MGDTMAYWYSSEYVTVVYGRLSYVRLVRDIGVPVISVFTDSFGTFTLTKITAHCHRIQPNHVHLWAKNITAKGNVCYTPTTRSVGGLLDSHS